MAKKQATFEQYTIYIHDDNSVSVQKEGEDIQGSVKATLREITEQVGLEYDPTWSARTFPSKLVDYINTKR